jgi:transposase
MPPEVPLRTVFSARELRRLARKSRNNNQSRRLLSLAAVLDGMSRDDASRIGGMDRQTLRDWVHWFNRGGPDALLDAWTNGPTPGPSSEQKCELAALVDAGPDRQADGVVRWRRIDLKMVIEKRFGVDFHERYVGTLLKQLGFSHVSARPRHPGQDVEIIAAFKKNVPQTLSAHLAELPEKTPVEIWFQDEARIGQKNGIVRQWSRRGSRPRQPADQRYENAYLFGAICLARGTGAAIAVPYADTEAMQLHLNEISRHVAKGAHAVLLLDRAGWHTTSKLDVPDNITPIFLPSRAPERNRPVLAALFGMMHRG